MWCFNGTSIHPIPTFRGWRSAFFTIDDLILDAFALVHQSKPRELNTHDLDHLSRLPQKRIAILIANWKEEDVLEQMVQGNIAQLEYERYSIFLGVYPNDLATWEIARKLEKIPNVSVIVNQLQGPTSKGQLLNEMVRQIIASEQESKMHYDAFLLQDSEDLIHPKSLALLNRELLSADFVQIPIFSLKTPLKQFTAGTYADEFAESHTKTLITREQMGAAVPSAGVGTAITRKLALALQDQLGGSFLNERTLTEDYQLGILAKRLGFKTKFSCYFFKHKNKREFIATREFFPDQIKNSVRQKTRWTAGISFQGAEHLGWDGNLVDRYFFWRDRKGPINSLLILSSMALGIAIINLSIFKQMPEILSMRSMQIAMWINFAHMMVRLFERMRATALVYGLVFSLLVPLRWPLANVINCFAAWGAYRGYRKSRKSGQQMAWVKTQHRMPANFGQAESRQPLIEKEVSA